MIKNFLYFVILVGLLSCKEAAKKLPYYNESNFTPVWKIPANKEFHTIRPFNLIDQEGKVFSEKNIENKICIVDFFFTVCPGICPKMTNNMSVLQKGFMSDDDVLLLSHTVMPETDSVQILREYAKQKGVNYNRWKLLTGSKYEIYDLGRKYYFVEEDLGEKQDTSIFLHTENFVLIDKNRMIRGIYNGLDPNSIASLIVDIKTLKKE